MGCFLLKLNCVCGRRERGDRNASHAALLTQESHEGDKEDGAAGHRVGFEQRVVSTSTGMSEAAIVRGDASCRGSASGREGWGARASGAWTFNTQLMKAAALTRRRSSSVEGMGGARPARGLRGSGASPKALPRLDAHFTHTHNTIDDEFGESRTCHDGRVAAHERARRRALKKNASRR